MSKSRQQLRAKRAEISALARKSEERTVFIDTEGAINQKSLNRYINQLTRGLSEDAARRLRNEIKMNVLSLKDNPKSFADKAITQRSFVSRMSSSKVEKFLINMGHSISELSEELGIDESEILNEKNWKDQTFNYNGKAWAFDFRYNGAYYTQI